VKKKCINGESWKCIAIVICQLLKTISGLIFGRGTKMDPAVDPEKLIWHTYNGKLDTLPKICKNANYSPAVVVFRVESYEIYFWAYFCKRKKKYYWGIKKGYLDSYRKIIEGD
jgi:hypothetical protein